MDLKYLNTFRTIVDEGSFTKAAEKLCYTQSTITFQIGQLEDELAMKLFEKIGRKMVLTKAGERLIPYVDEILASVDKLQNINEELSNNQGTVRIGSWETLLCYHLPEILKNFHEQAPKAKMFLYTVDYHSLREGIMDGSLDIAVYYDVPGYVDSNIMKTYTLGSYPLALLASPAVRDQFPDFITPNRHIPVPFIIDEPTGIFRQIFDRYLKERSIVLDHTIESRNITTIIKLVKNNLGITYLPRFAAQEEIDNGSLVEIPTELTGISVTAVCGHHKNKWISPLMQLFIDHCKELDK